MESEDAEDARWRVRVGVCEAGNGKGKGESCEKTGRREPSPKRRDGPAASARGVRVRLAEQEGPPSLRHLAPGHFRSEPIMSGWGGAVYRNHSTQR